MAARKWVEFVRLLSDAATADLDRVAEDIADAQASLNASGAKAQKRLDARKLSRARTRLIDARAKRAEIRAALLLDEDPDGSLA